jgi:hypothetical protein
MAFTSVRLALAGSSLAGSHHSVGFALTGNHNRAGFSVAGCNSQAGCNPAGFDPAAILTGASGAPGGACGG